MNYICLNLTKLINSFNKKKTHKTIKTIIKKWSINKTEIK